MEAVLRHRIGKRADVFDFHRDGVAGLEPHLRAAGETHALGCAGEDERAGGERLVGAEEGDDRGHVEDHVRRVGILHDRAVENRADAEGVRIRQLVGRHEHGAEWAEGVEALCVAPLAAAPVALPVAGGDVVGAGVAEHEGQRVLTGGVAAFASEHDGELGFVVGFGRRLIARKNNRIAGVLNATGKLHEPYGTLGRRLFSLGGVLRVVEADADDRRGGDGRETLAGLDDAVGDAVCAGEWIAGDFKGRTVGLERGVGGTGGGEVAEELHVRKASLEGAQAQSRKGSTDCLTTNGITQWGDSLGAVPANGLHD